MTADNLRELLYREPFQAFRVRVDDGRSFDIRYPKLNIVGESIFIIGLPDANDPRLYDHTVWVPIKTIDGAEPLPQEAIPAAS